MMIVDVELGRYFHLDSQSHQVFLIRPINELISRSHSIRLHINLTQNWIEIKTIEVRQN